MKEKCDSQNKERMFRMYFISNYTYQVLAQTNNKNIKEKLIISL